MTISKFEQNKNTEIMKSIVNISADVFEIKFNKNNTYIVKGSEFPFELNISPTSIDLTIEDNKRYMKIEKDNFFYSKDLEKQDEVAEKIIEALVEVVALNEKVQTITVKSDGERTSKIAKLDEEALKLKLGILGLQALNGKFKCTDYIENTLNSELASYIGKTLQMVVMFCRDILNINLKKDHVYTITINGKDRKVICDPEYIQINYDGDEYKIIPSDLLCTVNGEEEEDFDFPEMLLKFGFMFMNGDKFTVDDYYDGEHNCFEKEFDDLMATVKLAEMVNSMNDDSNDENVINVHLHL